MSGILTLRPTGYTADTGWVSSGGTIASCITDNSDATWMTDTAGGSTYVPCAITLAFPDTVLPVGAVIKRVTPRIRASQASGSVTLTVSTNPATFLGVPHGYVIPDYTFKPTATIATYTGPSGGKFVTSVETLTRIYPQNVLNDLTMTIKSNAANNAADDHRVYEVYLDVEYEEAPVAQSLVLSPSDANARTTKPTITWTYGDPENSPQVAYEVVVWKNSDTLDPSFPADPFQTSGNLFLPAPQFTDSGGTVHTCAATTGSAPDSQRYNNAIIGSATSWTPTVDLLNGETYKAYVRVWDEFGGKERQNPPASTPITFVMSVPIPPAPVGGGMTLTAEPTKYRVKIDLAASNNMLSSASASFETDPGTFTMVNGTKSLDTVVGNVLSGVQSLKLTSTAAGVVTATPPAAERVSVEAGQSYTAMASVKRSAALLSQVGLAFYNAAGTQVGTTTFAGWLPFWTNPGQANSYQPLAIKAVAPAGAVKAGLVYQFTATAAAQTLNVDQAAIQPTIGNPNYVYGGSFEQGAIGSYGDGWVAYNGGTTGTVTQSFLPATFWSSLAGARAGYVSSSALGTATTNWVGFQQYLGAIPAPASTFASRVFYFVGAAPTSGAQLVMEALFYDSTGAQVGSTLQTIGSVVTVDGVFRSLTLTGTVPAGAVSAVLRLYARGTGTAGAVTIQYDQFQLESGSSFSNYADVGWAQGGYVNSQYGIVERSFDNGATWVQITSSYQGSTPLFSTTFQRLTTYDTLYRPGATPQYRFRTRVYDSVLATYLYSNYSGIQAISTAGSGKFGLRSPTDPELYVTVQLSQGDLEDTTSETMAVFHPLGRAAPVVVTDVIQYEVFPMQATFRDGFSAATFKTLRQKQETLLLVGDDATYSRWIRFGADVRHRVVNNPSRLNAFARAEQFDFEAIVVDAPFGQPVL